jgi:alkylhydroperoxidase/carboxymuconolactone decarboxylase family protein YurZ
MKNNDFPLNNPNTLETSSISTMVRTLYGEEEAQKVSARCHDIDPWFNHYVQTFVYDILWNLPPLSLLEKSMTTLVALTTLNKEEQLTIHLKGFLHVGGTVKQFLDILNYMQNSQYISSVDPALAILENGVTSEEVIWTPTTQNNSLLTDRYRALIDVGCIATLGNNNITKSCFSNILENKLLSKEDIGGVLRHIMVYTGCPCTMNGFAVLNEILESK